MAGGVFDKERKFSMFIGRGETLAQILGRMSTSGADGLSGPIGTGKTAILRQLEENVFLPQRAVYVNLKDFNPGHAGEIGSSASVGAVQGSFQQFAALLETLLARINPAEATCFRRDVEDARNAEVLEARVSSLRESIAELAHPLGPQDLAETWRTAASVVADHFVDRWERTAPGARWVLLVDNTDEVVDQEIGVWFGALLPRLSGTSVVLTRNPRKPGLPLTAGEIREFALPGFSREEVRAYLDTATESEGRERVSDFLARKIYETSQGHPATLATLYDLLRTEGALSGNDAADLLRDLPERAEEKAAALTERVVRRRDDEVLVRAMWAAAVPRQLDARLLQALLVDPPLPPADQERVFSALADFRFAEKLDREGRRLRVNSSARAGLLQRLLRNEPERFDQLHQRAADFYRDELLRAGDSSERYGSAFVYEQPVWQGWKREWLYHRGYATSERSKSKALLEFTRVFLEAWWWWGNYIHFDFSDQLVTDLGHLVEWRTPHPADGDWPFEEFGRGSGYAWPELVDLHDCLRRMLRGYPLRSVKAVPTDWEDLRSAALTVQRLCGIRPGSVAELKGDRAQVAALLRTFLAHTWRYQDPALPKADAYYDDARQLFARSEAWSEPWIGFERAELRVERDNLDEVPTFWFAAARLVQPLRADGGGRADEDEDDDEDDGDDELDEPDEELIANLHRLRADCCWLTGDRRRAAAWYGRAVLHAYLFHLVGGPPDDYTLQFYIDLRARSISKLLEVHRSDPQEALALALTMASAFPRASAKQPDLSLDGLSDLLADGTPLLIAHALFPRGPDVAELGKSHSRFTAELDGVSEFLDHEAISRDLHDLSWP